MILTNYSYVNPISYWRNVNYSEPLYRVDGHDENKRIYLGQAADLNKLYDKNLLKDFDLTKMKKVFFDPMCNYPRYKLSQFTSVKRCLSPDKADAVIVSKVEYTDNWLKYHVFHDSSEDHYYFVSENNFDRYMNDIYPELNISKLDKFIKHIKRHKIINNDLTYKGFYNIVYITEDAEKSISVLSGSHKFILDRDLDIAISKNLNNVDESDIESIDELLGSSDISTVGLGMDLLINYNVTEKACTLGMLLFKHKDNILRSSKINSVGFKNIMTALKISKSDLSYYNENGKLHYINKLYGIATNEEDKRLAYKMAVSIVQDQLNRSFESMKDVVSNLGIKADIKAY